MGFLAGKKALIIGVASKKSIAWGIAQSMFREGAEIALTYQNERLKDRVIDFASACNSTMTYPCDVEHDADIEALMTELGNSWGTFDILVHAVGFAPRDQLEGDYLDNVTREGFRVAHDISSYSFAALGKAAKPLLSDTGALLTLSYLGAVRSMPNYNVMGLAKASLEANTRFMAHSLGPHGVRVNAISAGPIRTLAASGIGDFKTLLNYVAATAPMKRNVTIEQVGDTAAFLCSDMAAGITGQIVYVDNGFNNVAIPPAMT
jgi:enoyl-[acyl-carrier protein] reductase I